MLPVKNFSPQQVAVVTCFPLGLLGGIAVYFYGAGILPALIFFILLSLASYIFIYFMIQRFVYRKIKIIYKLIYQTKASKR
ncbi:MAG: sensor histidine kinase, partial [Ginsengibacter sp.]